MLKRTVCSILLILSLLFSLGLNARAEGFFPSLSAKASVLMDADSGRILLEKNSTVRMPMASTTKIMTALIAIERGGLDERVTVTEESVGVEGSSVYLTLGETLTLKELLYALMLASANDAATAIAVHIAGGAEAFSSLMNEKAEELGLSGTHFENPHGLDGKDHYTTARDLASLTAYALRNDTFSEIVSTYKYNISGNRQLFNHNKLLRTYKGCVGVKTGYTRADGRCLVSAASRNGVTLIAVTLSAPDDWRDHAAMLDYGFKYYVSKTLCRHREVIISLPDVSSPGNKIECAASEGLRLTLPKSGEITKTVECPRFFWETPKKGAVVGRVIYYRNGKELARTDLTAK